MKTLERLVAERLLKIKAVKLQPANPFTWASGWKSPIYNDNRKTLSYPEIRSFIKLELARTISEKYENADAIAGVATGAIAQGALVADLLGLPFVHLLACLAFCLFDAGNRGGVDRYSGDGLNATCNPFRLIISPLFQSFRMKRNGEQDVDRVKQSGFLISDCSPTAQLIS